eukprot:TRINITY_DN652_c0_g1_i1.p2 TRINITY_DN652_c0_g1~~TRINITY_DN652_c0_g1_i1.p2  ORF type:complete len:136 (+),score=35.26 TRINITY_DN652_c0_g1_i1:68-475(+)
MCIRDRYQRRVHGEYKKNKKMSIGIPVKLLHEAENHFVTVELRTGELFKGILVESEDSMNLRLDNADMFHKEGKKQHFDQVYLRGSQVKFIVVPDMFKNAPMFKRLRAQSKQRNAALLREKYQQYKPVINAARQK